MLYSSGFLKNVEQSKFELGNEERIILIIQFPLGLESGSCKEHNNTTAAYKNTLIQYTYNN